MGLSLLGFLPDILTGKKPKNALMDAAKTAALAYGGYSLLGPGAASSGLLGSGTALPSGGMTATGTTSLADAGLLGGGGLSTLPAGGMATTGSLSAGDAALMGAKGGMDSAISSPTALQSFMGYAKPVGEAAIAANSVNSLLGGNRQPLPPSPITQPQPNGNLNQIVSGNDQQSQFFQQQNEQERARRMALLARMGGR